MPHYNRNEFVYIYDLGRLAFGTIVSFCQSQDEDGIRYETYRVLCLGRAETCTCTPPQLRRACWTFTGPVVVPGGNRSPYAKR